MRTVRFSRTFDLQFVDLLEFGERTFGEDVAIAKRRTVYRTISQFLARFPGARRIDPRHGLCAYPISGTPFVVLYDFDDDELRVHFDFHRSADLSQLDPSAAEW